MKVPHNAPAPGTLRAGRTFVKLERITSLTPFGFVRSRMGAWPLAVCVLLAFASCKSEPGLNSHRTPSAAKPGAGLDSAKIVESFRAANAPDRSTIKLKVKIKDADQSSREVHLTTYRSRKPDGGQMMLIEFTAPAEERDRSSLITIGPQGDIEAMRYAQSTGNYVSAKGATTEDSLFGLSLQELVEGQPEKYDFIVTGEETVKSTPVYRLEGKLKEGAESRFPKIVVMILKDNYATSLAEFYDAQGALARRMEVDAFEQISGHSIRNRFTIDNVARRKNLDFEVVSASFDGLPGDSLFTREHLKAISLK